MIILRRTALISFSTYSIFDDDPRASALKVIFPLITAIGIGGLFQTPLIGIQAAMPVNDMATSTATFVLLRTLGGTMGISIGQAIWSSVSRSEASHFPS